MAITKTRGKKFSSFEAEEQWLNEQADSGWRLIDYRNNEILGSRYIFEVDLSVKGKRYMIDFRTLKSDREFKDYKEFYHKAGWNLIAKNYRYQKFILISEETNEVLTDSTSLIERERNRRKVVSFYTIFFVLAAIVSLMVLLVKDYDWIIGSTIVFSLIVLQQSITIFKGNQAIKKYNHD